MTCFPTHPVDPRSTPAGLPLRPGYRAGPAATGLAAYDAQALGPFATCSAKHERQGVSPEAEQAASLGSSWGFSKVAEALQEGFDSAK